MIVLCRLSGRDVSSHVAHRPRAGERRRQARQADYMLTHNLARRLPVIQSESHRYNLLERDVPDQNRASERRGTGPRKRKRLEEDISVWRRIQFRDGACPVDAVINFVGKRRGCGRSNGARGEDGEGIRAALGLSLGLGLLAWRLR